MTRFFVDAIFLNGNEISYFLNPIQHKSPPIIGMVVFGT
jgi:hypothetical protein